MVKIYVEITDSCFSYAPDEWTLTTSSKRKLELIKQTKELFEQGLIKIPKQDQNLLYEI